MSVTTDPTRLDSHADESSGTSSSPAAAASRPPDCLKPSRAACGWIALLGFLFVGLSHRPLYHTDVWGHLAYGRWICEHGTLPSTEPLLPLSDGVPMIDTAWLGQVIGFVMYRRFGVTALQFLYALPITIAAGLLLWGVLRGTRGSVVTGLIALFTFGWVDYQQLLIVRPQLVGLVFFVALFVMLQVWRWRSLFWVVVPLMFVLWANLHGSWIVGLGLLATCGVGHAIDVTRRTRNVRAAFSSRRVRQLLGVTMLAGLAVLLNPYGYKLYAEVLSFTGNLNVQDLIEWKPLTLLMSQGRAAAVIAVALLVVGWFSPRRVTASEVLLLTGLGGAALWSSRMIHWWAPLAGYYLALHSASLWQAWRHTSRTEPKRSRLMTAMTVGLLAICFLSTPFASVLLHGKPDHAADPWSQFRSSTSAMTPVAAAAYLDDEPVDGLILNSFEWGDFLLFAGPQDVQLFTNSHVHLIPREVWKDSLAIEYVADGWEERLDTYGVAAVVLNVRTDAALVEALKGKPGSWRLVFEDRTTAVFRRSEP